LDTLEDEDAVDDGDVDDSFQHVQKCEKEDVGGASATFCAIKARLLSPNANVAKCFEAVGWPACLLVTLSAPFIRE